MKRVDWDPHGERNPQNRGYHPSAILCEIDGHGETKIVHAAHGCITKLLDLCGGFTLQSRQPD